MYHFKCRGSYLENSETKVQTTKAEGSKCQVCWKITKEHVQEKLAQNN